MDRAAVLICKLASPGSSAGAFLPYHVEVHEEGVVKILSFTRDEGGPLSETRMVRLPKKPVVRATSVKNTPTLLIETSSASITIKLNSV